LFYLKKLYNYILLLFYWKNYNYIYYCYYFKNISILFNKYYIYIKGTGTFGRVFLTRFRHTDNFFAMKVMKKSEIVRLKQVEHINSEKSIISKIKHPFIVNM